MPYTARQRQYLSAMGLVAWRSRVPGGASAGTVPASAATPVAASVVASSVDPGGASGAAPNAAPVVAPALAAALPRSPAALAAWLPEQSLAPFPWNGQHVSHLGRDAAPILVLVESTPAGPAPVSGAAAELFERMLGSIGRSGGDTCQCVLASTPSPEGTTVAARAGAARPVTLVLVRELDVTLDADGCRLPGSPFGGAAWCLPHPERLLGEPAGKRQAWHVLEAVRRQLPLLP